MDDSVTINGIKYVRETVPGEIKIMILQRGFVYVGRVTRSGNQVTISKAQNIRQWGTTRGLGEIATAGPTEKTKMDPAGTVTCHELGVVAELACNQAAWEVSCK